MAGAPYLRPMHAVQDLAEIGGQGDQDFRTFTAHTHQAHRGLWICVGFGIEYHGYSF